MSDEREYGTRLQEATHAYVGILSCGCCVAAVVDTADKFTAKEVAGFIRRGYVVERKPMEWVRKNLRRCIHEKAKNRTESYRCWRGPNDEAAKGKREAVGRPVGRLYRRLFRSVRLREVAFRYSGEKDARGPPRVEKERGEAMSDKTWKAVERRVAAFFGTQRNRCSGSSGRTDESASDTVHPTLYIETKHGELARFLNAEGRAMLAEGVENAKREGKRFVAAMHAKQSGGFWILIHSDDFLFAAKDTMARTETKNG